MPFIPTRIQASLLQPARLIVSCGAGRSTEQDEARDMVLDPGLSQQQAPEGAQEVAMSSISGAQSSGRPLQQSFNMNSTSCRTVASSAR
jgi:hypothetical protein